MFSYVSLEQRVPSDHPLREVRKVTDVVLHTLSPELDALYAEAGRPSIAPEYILRGLLLQVFFSIRSERLLVEQIDYNLLFRWFVGLGMDDAVWNHAVFSKNRDRLLTAEAAQRFFAEVNRQAKKFMSDEHFTVDGTLIQAWASQKSFRPKDGDGPGDGTNFHGQKRSNKTHESTTDPDARLYRKSYGKESKLSYLGHALVENRNGLIAAAMVTHADGFAERDAALLMLRSKQMGRSRRITVGADKAYDTKDFVRTVRELNVTTHVTKNDKNRQQPGPENHAPAGLCPQSQPSLVNRKELRLAQADRTTAPDQTARTEQSRLAVRLQLRCAQLTTPAQDDRPTTSASEEGAVCLNQVGVLPGTRKTRSTHIKSRVQTDLNSATSANPQKTRTIEAIFNSFLVLCARRYGLS
jgi:transposase